MRSPQGAGQQRLLSIEERSKATSFPQKLLQAILPRHWAEEMEAESRAWMLRCKTCGLERSVWEMGGVRWKAVGRPSRLAYCAQCGRATWHTLYRKQAGTRTEERG
jgi:hypothetical protein